MSRPESSHPAMRVQRSRFGSIDSSREGGPRSRSPSPRGHRRYHHHRSSPSRRSSYRSYRSPSPRRFSRVRSVGASSFHLPSVSGPMCLCFRCWRSGGRGTFSPLTPAAFPSLSENRSPSSSPILGEGRTVSDNPPSYINHICKSFSPPDGNGEPVSLFKWKVLT